MRDFRKIFLGVALGCVIAGAWARQAASQERPATVAVYNGRDPYSWYSNGPSRHKHKGEEEGRPCNCVGCYARPYRTSSCVYGYQDYAYGRGPLINLGGASLEPGFRGYGPFGSPGYGLGLRPSSVIDAQANAKGWRLIK